MSEPVRTQANEVDPRLYDVCLSQGWSPLASRVIAARLTRAETPDIACLNPTLDAIPDPAMLAGIEAATDRLSSALDNGETISISVDHDADGVTAATVILDTLRVMGHPADRLQLHASHRLVEGYGLSDALVERILAEPARASLVITADHGSADEERIARLATEGIDTIVTDHHMLPLAGPPVTAVATVNPQRPECHYPDGAIAGCMVAWLVLSHLAKKREFTRSLEPLLAVVAVGTVADCVDLSSATNRAVVQRGLAVMQTSQRPCWQAVRHLVGDAPLDSGFLAFQLCPRLASPGRTDAADPGIAFLRSRRVEDAFDWLAYLTAANEHRKDIERAMRGQVLAEIEDTPENDSPVICHFARDGHPGIHGIVAARMVERFARPAVMLSPHARDPGLITGSCRSVEGVDIRGLLQSVSDAEPNLFRAFGGHTAAAGLTIAAHDLDRLRTAIIEHARAEVAPDAINRAMCTDGEVAARDLTLEQLEELARLDPWGMGFARPAFEAEFEVETVKMVGRDNPVHASMTLALGSQTFKSIWFFATDDPVEPAPVAAGQRLRFVFELGEDRWRGNRQVQIIVRALVAPEPRRNALSQPPSRRRA